MASDSYNQNQDSKKKGKSKKVTDEMQAMSDR